MAGEPLTGVSETALGAAMLRAEESARPDRLFDDALAATFVAAAPEIFADGPEPGDPEVEQLRRSFTDQLALRTRFYDDYVLDATEDSCSQVVLLGAGLDTRAFRLDWPANVRLFELDLPEVLAFKQTVLDADDAQPRCTRVAIGADLAQDWDDRLLDAGFDPDAVTAWAAEGLLAYLSDEQAETLLARVSNRSSPRSRFAAEAARLTDDATLVEASTLSSLAPITAMWHGGLRDDPAHWLEAHGWTVERHDRVVLAERYRRPIADASTGGFLIAHRIEPARGGQRADSG
jgi:methyltransferase (TIGR00027 family)